MKKQTIAVLVFGALQLVQGGAWASTGHEHAGASAHAASAPRAANRVSAVRNIRLRAVLLTAGRARLMRQPRQRGGLRGVHMVMAEQQNVGADSLDAVTMGVVNTMADHVQAMERAAGGLQSSSVFSGNKVYLTANAHDAPVTQYNETFQRAAGLADQFGAIAQALTNRAANPKLNQGQREALGRAAVAAGQAQQVYAQIKGVSGQMRDAHNFARDAAARGDSTGGLNATNQVMSLWGTLAGAVGKANDVVKDFHGNVADATRPSNWGG